MNPTLLPAPQKVVWMEGAFTFPDFGLIILDTEDPQQLLPAGAVLEKALWTTLHLNWEINASTKAPGEMSRISFQQIRSNNARSQLYILEVNQKNITIKGETPASIFYGAQTLSQLVRQYGREIPCVEITDWPDFEHRGVMLDVSRDKVYKNETLYDLVDRLASLKINQIQLYTEHTFAYHQHPIVWKDASPLTGEEVMALDRYCKDRYIELVPNQNSFGHMTRWLKYPQYAHLAEIHGAFEVPWGTMTGPFSLAPVNVGSEELVFSLFDELLPHFSSRMFNIGCDETFDLGAGQSKVACDLNGVGNVYLNFLLRLYQNVKARGFTVQFWGDIILQHPDLVEKLPKDLIALEWGYEADHPFAEHSMIFSSSGLSFYVCPGTSAWNSIAGRTDNALKNLFSAAENGKGNHAIGYLNTDWGDNGHWQAVPVSYLGYAMGAAYSWSVDASKTIDVKNAISRWFFDDPSGNMGAIFYDLGNVYHMAGKEPSNSSFLFDLFRMPFEQIKTSNPIGNDALNEIQTHIDQIMSRLINERMTRTDADIIRSEALLTARMLQHACNRAAAANDPTQPVMKALASDLAEITAEYRRIWLVRNRVGGLSDSIQPMERMLAEYNAFA